MPAARKRITSIAAEIETAYYVKKETHIFSEEKIFLKQSLSFSKRYYRKASKCKY